MSSMLPVDRTVWECGSQIQDPLAAKFGVRMIVIDRPGCGGTGQVPSKSESKEAVVRFNDLVFSQLMDFTTDKVSVRNGSFGS